MKLKLPWHREEQPTPDIIQLVEDAEQEHDRLVALLRERLDAMR